MRRCGIAVWGIGPHARRNIVPAILTCRQFELRGLCSRGQGTVAELAAELGCRYWVDPESMLADGDVEVVYLSTPIGLHAAHGQQILAAGKHLWCEKPLAANLAQVHALLAMARKTQASVAEGFMYLYHPHFAALAELSCSSMIGTIRSFSCSFGIPPLERPGFRLTPALGGGAFLDVGCYPISTAAALFPNLQPEILTAELVRGSNAAIDCSGRAILRYPGVTRAVLEWGTDCAYRNEVNVWGSHGSLRSDFVFSKAPGHVPSLELRDLRGNTSTVTVAPANHFECMLNAFHATLRDAGAAERERERILERAALMERIRIAAGQESTDARREQ